MKQKQILIGLAVVVALVAAIVGIVALTGDDDDGDGGPTTTSSSTTTEETSTTETTTPSSSTTLDPQAADQALFPDPTSTEQFTDPREAAAAFARQVLGFRGDAVVGAFAQGDSRSGEVGVGVAEGAPPTTILLRQLTDGDAWFVIGATTESIRLDTPIPGAVIRSPQPIIGAGFAFEGHIDVTLYADGQPEPIAQGFVTGRGDGIPGPFNEDLEYEVPDGVTRGVLVLSAPSGDDGSTVVATAVRVRF